MFQLRRATLADVDAFTAHRVAVFRQMHGLAGGAEESSFDAMTRTAFTSLVVSPSTFAWLAIAPDGQDQAVGSASLHTFERFPSLQNPFALEGYVSHVYVIPPWRRRGVGAALVDAVLTQARRLGLRRVRLHATESGRALYETLGFRLRANDMDVTLHGTG